MAFTFWFRLPAAQAPWPTCADVVAGADEQAPAALCLDEAWALVFDYAARCAAGICRIIRLGARGQGTLWARAAREATQTMTPQELARHAQAFNALAQQCDCAARTIARAALDRASRGGPAGAHPATAADMARYRVRFFAVRILDEEIRVDSAL